MNCFASWIGALAVILSAANAVGAQSAAIPASTPLHEEHGVLLFEAMLNGVGPLLFTLDPGGEDVYTSYARGRLKNRAPRSVCISRTCFSAEMRYFDGDGSELDPKHDPALGSIAGSIGPQLLRHYAVRIDYRSSSLTLIPPAQFHPPRGEHRLPLTLDSYGMPVAKVQVDGISGSFEIDVRAGTSMLFGPFLDRTGLRRTYTSAPVVRQSGTLTAYAVHHVQIDGVELHDVPFWFSNATSGKFANPDVGGLLGNDVLSHFVVTFDVPDNYVYLRFD